MDIRRRVGLNVAKFRKNHGLSQEDLALECNIHRTYISGVERGIRNPTVVVLEKIAKALTMAPGRLLDPDHAPTPPETVRRGPQRKRH